MPPILDSPLQIDLKNLDLSLLYPKGRTITKEKEKDMMDFVPPSKHDYYKNLRTNWHDRTSNVCDEEDIIIYVDDSI